MSDLSIHRLGEQTMKLAKSLECPPLVAAVIDSRESFSRTIMEDFLREPRLDDLMSDIELGSGLEDAFKLWKCAVPGKKVLIYGDYDVDGVSSTVLAIELAQMSRASLVRYYIPQRDTEGYGLHVEEVKRVLAGGFDSMIVVDCGSKDVEAIELAIKQGLNVIVFDHHAVKGNVIKLSSFLNPQQDGNDGAKMLCAAGVLWAWAWKTQIVPRQELFTLLELVALATIADCMPVRELNREIIRTGLHLIRTAPRSGLYALLHELKLNLDLLDENDLAMKVIPCLNAAGRLYVADLSVDVLAGLGDLSSNVKRLLLLNKRRRDISAAICSNIDKNIASKVSHVFYDRAWPVGILSAVASRLCNEHNEAFALAAPSCGGIRGTLRVPDGANAVTLLSKLDNLLTAWGGHQYAAGFAVDQLRWPQVSAELELMLSSLEVKAVRQEVIDLDPECIGTADWQQVLKLGPFGNENPSPFFYTSNEESANYRPLGSTGLHLRINAGKADLLAFNGAKKINELSRNSSIAGWVYRPRFNFWRGQTNLQFIVDKIVIND